jgi:hypothetical protein
MLVAPSTTWLFVSTSPSELRIMPVPALSAFWYLRTETIVTMPFCCSAVASDMRVDVPLPPRFMSPGMLGSNCAVEPEPWTVAGWDSAKVIAPKTAAAVIAAMPAVRARRGPLADRDPTGGSG